MTSILNWALKKEADQLKQSAQEFVQSYISMILDRLTKLAVVHETDIEMYTNLYNEKNKLIQKIEITQDQSIKYPVEV